MNKDSLLLKVLTGPHIGAEMAIKNGSYEIGKDADCSVVLHDEMIDGKHVSIEIENDNIVLTKLSDLPVFVNGNEQESEKFSVNKYDVIEIGTTHFSVGNLGGNWRGVKVIPHELMEKKSSLEVFAKNISNMIVENKNKIIALYEEYSNKVKKILGLKIEEKSEDKIVDGVDNSLVKNKRIANHYGNKNKSIRTNSLATKLVGVACIIIAIVGLSYQSVMQFFPGKTDYEKAFSYIKDQQLDNVIVSKAEDHIFFNGYVANSDIDNKLQNFLRLNNIAYKERLFVDTDIISRANAIKDIYKLKYLTLDYTGVGHFDVSGYISTKKIWHDLKKSIVNDVPGIIKISEKNVSDIAHRKKKLQEIINKKDMEGNLMVTSQASGELSIRGVLSEEKIPEWKESIEEFRNKYGEFPVINSFVMNPKDIIKLKIRELQIGDINFFVTEDGTRYFEGAYVSDGFLIKKIESSHVVLEKNGMIANFPIGA